jgi:hypothetical protein
MHKIFYSYKLFKCICLLAEILMTKIYNIGILPLSAERNISH